MWWYFWATVIWVHAKSWQRIWHANDIHGTERVWCNTRNSGEGRVVYNLFLLFYNYSKINGTSRMAKKAFSNKWQYWWIDNSVGNMESDTEVQKPVLLKVHNYYLYVYYLHHWHYCYWWYSIKDICINLVQKCFPQLQFYCCTSINSQYLPITP